MINNSKNIIKYLENRISDKELKELNTWVSEKKEHQAIFKEEIINWCKSKNVDNFSAEDGLSRFLTSIDADLKGKRSPDIGAKKILPIYKITGYAAILIGVFLCINFFFKHNTVTKNSSYTNNNSLSVSKNSIKITRSDGSVYYTNSHKEENLTNTSGNIIATKNNNRIVFNQKSNSSDYSELEISIPKGNIMEIILSDGTSVWLNAESKLKFPSQFKKTGKQRLVSLYGEAYFDVAKNTKKPFIVKTEDLTVKVLGTEFNISNYKEDNTVKTTLIEGSVTLNRTQNSESTLLAPNDQVIFHKANNQLKKIKLTNVKPFIAWKQKRMVIINEAFKDIRKKIERSYNVTIIGNNKKLDQTHFTGEFDTEKVEEILNIFKQTIDFKFTIKDNMITITP